jgi:hypothetical protein
MFSMVLGIDGGTGGSSALRVPTGRRKPHERGIRRIQPPLPRALQNLFDTYLCLNLIHVDVNLIRAWLGHLIQSSVLDGTLKTRTGNSHHLRMVVQSQEKRRA